MNSKPRQFNARKIIIIFMFSVPCFFVLAIAGLYFIVMEEHIQSHGMVVLQNQKKIFSPEDGIISSLNNCYKIDINRPLIVITNRYLSNKLNEYSNQLKNYQIQLKIAKLSLKSYLNKKQIKNNIDIQKQNLKIAQLKNNVAFTRQLQNNIFNRIQKLSINCPKNIISLSKLNIGQKIKQGDLIGICGNKTVVNIIIEVNQKYINKIKIGQRIRFKSNTFSVNKSFNNYYTGIIKSIDNIASINKDKKIIYRVTADIDFNKNLPNLPIGSSGTAYIIIGQRSLLLQLIGY